MSTRVGAWSMIAAVTLGAAGCATAELPKTYSETVNQYGYHPIDPLPVSLDNLEKCAILSALTDDTMRIAVMDLTAQGSLKSSIVTIGTEGRNYTVVFDYTKSTTVLFRASIEGKKVELRTFDSSNAKENEFAVPVYVGIGARVTARVHVAKGNVDLSNLALLAASAQSGAVSGTLVIQTLGLTGEGVSPLLPVTSEINPTTIQNALMAIGQIKNKMYDRTAHVEVSPRIVGFYDVLTPRVNASRQADATKQPQAPEAHPFDPAAQFISIALREKFKLDTLPPGSCEPRTQISWRSLAYSLRDQAGGSVDPRASRAVLEQFKAKGIRPRDGFLRCGFPGEDPDRSETWGPANPGQVNWAGF